ncbi:polysaccharide pyruvyl transferase family protein [Pseudoalteromonas sp. CnMc7-15]|uniref:polysaccharide pyruvyl transferase family protein n=1 Tax=unclassified Pseudoalteromonas TaxID=194690 RepID=UPI001EF45773|nr:polysaccharide pyruvyl transferase family protein [Pseudoalteromonas sp. CnMc7-15]MCG7566510.1 polysaccharide pyruvyl transferase family protein [Pseudoalteromonas sp. CnMc7-15]
MIIEVKGVQFTNKGAELMLAAVKKTLAQHLPNAKIAIAPSNNASAKQIQAQGYLVRRHIRKRLFDLNSLSSLIPAVVRHYLRQHHNTVYEADLDAVLDASGLSYGDQGNDIVLAQTAKECTRLKRRGIPYIFLPQSLGPFTRKKNQHAAKQAFSQARLIFAREHTSLGYVQQLVGKDAQHLFLAPDFTNLLAADTSEATTKGRFLIIPNSKMLSEKNSDTRWQATYQPLLSKLGSALVGMGEEVAVLNHSGREDKALCQQLAKQIGNVEVITPNSAIAVKRHIGDARAVICSRFHGCVSALSQGVPCLATGWSHKYQELFAEYGCSEYLLAPNKTPDYIRQQLGLLTHPPALTQAQLTANAEQYKQQSEAMWRQVLEVLNGSQD